MCILSDSSIQDDILCDTTYVCSRNRGLFFFAVWLTTREDYNIHFWNYCARISRITTERSRYQTGYVHTCYAAVTHGAILSCSSRLIYENWKRLFTWYSVPLAAHITSISTFNMRRTQHRLRLLLHSSIRASYTTGSVRDFNDVEYHSSWQNIAPNEYLQP